jgi:hypothetical protein
MVPKKWNEMRNNCFAEEFPDVGNMPFWKIYEQRPKFVEFALCWDDASGVYGQWKEYCEGRKLNVTSTDS